MASSSGQLSVAVVYDDSLRADTTGGYCLRALEPLARVTHFRPAALSEIPKGPDLLLRVDDGLDYRLPPSPVLSAFWAIDTHLNFPSILERARDSDLVFAAQKEGARRLIEHGTPNCEWLALACDPEIHRRLEVAKEYDVAFVGHVFPGPRQDLLTAVQHHFPSSFIGQVPHTQMAEVYSRARIVINCCLANDLNMRVFETLSCGALLITNRLRDNGQEELFQDRGHLVEYESIGEALDLIAYYLEHEDERDRIADAGHREAVTHHTYRHRMERVLERVNEWLATPREKKHAQTACHDRQYFQWPRPDLLELIPRTAERVLDVGCAAGVMGEAVKRRQQCEVVGIELDPRAAREAEEKLDRLIEGDVESLDLSSLGRFDVVVCGDVLEHLRGPAQVLRKLRRVLSPDGLLIASFPNVRHMDVVLGLVEGNWTYEPAGLLDRDHLRFFTRRSAEQLLEEAGFQVREVRGVPGAGLADWQRAGRPRNLQAGRIGISGLSEEEAEEFFVGQWLITARPAARVEWGLTSIVLVTCYGGRVSGRRALDELAYTRLCLESIRKHTHLPHEMIVVDNGSTRGAACADAPGVDGTVEWLESQSDVKVIRNPTNLGFARAADQGLRAAQGENLLLLNNDTVVTPGWLRRLLEHLHSSPDVGMVGPLTNFASGEQQIPVPYQDLTGVEGFAWDLGRRQRGRAAETDRLVGFCLAMKREMIEKIGLLDEQFEVGCFEDDDICRRAMAAGYRLLVCHDAFVAVRRSGDLRYSGECTFVLRVKSAWEMALRRIRALLA
jgi:GT2 family glycosyltransferase/2-polyprenyl-3-methyl-5-hydroxy-6-metoxy-1,4-benzoquinol methylase